MNAIAEPPLNDLDLLRALLANPTLSADEAGRFAGVPVPAVAMDDEPEPITLNLPNPQPFTRLRTMK